RSSDLGSVRLASADPAPTGSDAPWIEDFSETDPDQIEGGRQHRDAQRAGEENPPGDVPEAGEHLLPGQALVDEIAEPDATSDGASEVEEGLGHDRPGDADHRLHGGMGHQVGPQMAA